MTLLFGQAGTLITCRGCDCDDDHACVTEDGPCSWALLDIGARTGICSVCAARAKWHPLALICIGIDTMEEALERALAFVNLAPGYERDLQRIFPGVAA